MSSPSASTWPIAGGDVATPANIRWESVKTEEEAYLDKLHSKLSRIQTKMGTPRMEVTNMNPDDMPYDDMPSVRTLRDDDPGLHLLYDFPHSAHRSPSPTQSEPESTPTTPTARPRLVRFRSRVRITSGVHKPASASSSTAESVSSSISAPLRGLRRNADSGPAPLSGLLSPDAANVWLRGLGHTRRAARDRRRDAQRNAQNGVQNGVQNGAHDERTPLISTMSPAVRAYTEPEEDEDAEYERMRAAARKSEEEVMFGGWPWRLINRHWWWWKLQPFVCCCARFDDESDDE